MDKSKPNENPLHELEKLRLQYAELKAAYEKNIAEQKQAKKQLKNSEARYKSIFESTGTATLIVDEDTTILLANNECLEMFGYDPASLIKQKWTQFVAPESLKKMLRNHNLRRQNPDLATNKYEVKLLNRIGDKRDVILHVKMITDTLHSVVSIMDITEHKKAEVQIEKYKSELEEYFENDISADYVVSASGEIFSCNKTFLSLFGFEKKSDIQKFDITNLYKNPKDREQIICLIKQDRKVENYEVEFISKERKAIHVLINEIGIFDKDDKLEKIRGYIVDITRQKNIERELVKFKLCIERSFESIFITDVKGHIIFINPAFEKMYGFSPIEAIGKTPRIIKSGTLSQDTYDYFWELLLAKKHVTGEIINKTKDGRLITIEGFNTSILDSEGNINGFIGIHRDITTLKKSIEEIRLSEEKFSKLFQSSPDAITLTKKSNRKIDDVNNSACTLTGYSKEELIGQPILSLKFWKNKSELLKYTRLIEQNKRVENFEAEFIVKSGEIRSGLVSSETIQIQDDEYVIGIIRDITLRKKAEDSLKLFRTLINNSNDAFEIVDPTTGRFLDVNKIGCDELGYSFEEFIKLSVFDIDPAVTPEIFKGIVDELRKSNFITWEGIHKRNDGSTFPVEVNIRMANLEKEYMVTVARDISTRKQNEELVLKQSHALEQSPVSIIITDKNGNIEYSNSKTFELTGYEKEEILGKNPRIFSSGETPLSEYKILWANLLSGKQWKGEFLNKKKNGDLFWEFAYISPILNVKNEIINFVAIKEDITERKNMIEELIFAKEKAEESDRLKSSFLANMSHEIRTPMNGIFGFTNLLLEPDLSSEEKENFIKIIYKSGQRMLSTVNDIVEISKIEAGLVDVIAKETDINERVVELTRFFQLEAEQKGLMLILEKLLPVEKKKVMTDQNKLDSILTNLIKNAIKYTDTGTIKIGCSQKETNVEFYIEDTGIGIPAHRREAVFNRFEQADIDDKRAFQGSGLGLAISKSYIEMLGGKIWVESEEGKGSIFYFLLPVKNNTQEKPFFSKDTLSVGEKAKHNIKGLKILIAEDDEPSQQFLSILIRDFASELLKVKTGNEVIEICRQNKDIDLILMDIQMPGLDGYEATRRIREFNKEVIVIAQTAYAISGDKEKAIEAGCNDYISKPINKTKLQALLQKYFVG